MGMQFYDSSNGTGIVNLLEDLTGTSAASSSSYPLAKKTRDINNAFAHFMFLAMMASGKLQVDDYNQAKYPILRFDLVSGQGDYPFSVDGETTPNQILKILRVECANSSGHFSVLDRFDQSDETESLNYLRSQSGQPYRYDELANGIFIDPKPNFNYTAGLEVTVSRTPTYFLTSDTTKKPGIPDMFHEYLAYRPAYLYAVSKLPTKVSNGYWNFLQDMEKKIALYYAGRNALEHRRMRTKRINHT